MKIYTEMDINTIYIVLGLSCNFNCKYCYEKNMQQADLHIENDLIDYIKYLISLKPFAKENPTKIMFWGGEPLIYMDVIKKIISELKELPFTYGTVSNGSLFTDEMVDYFNDNKISVGISHDGINTIKTRNIDVLSDKKILKTLRKLHHVCIDSVISAYNYDYISTLDYIYNKFDREIPVYFEWLHCDEGAPTDLYNIDYSQYQYNLDSYFNVIKRDILLDNYSVRVRSVLPDIKSVFSPSPELSPRCKQMKKVLNLDLQGNVMACHPGVKLGNIKNDYSDLVEKYDKQINQAFSFADCGNCKWIMSCKAGCPLEKPCEGKLAICKAKCLYFNKIQEFFTEVVI